MQPDIRFIKHFYHLSLLHQIYDYQQFVLKLKEKINKKNKNKKSEES